jgi:hypothetical protein
MRQKIETTMKKSHLKVDHHLLSCKTLSSDQKLIIAEVLSFQSNGLACFISNQALADKLGLSKSTIKRLITQLNKLPFFCSQETSRYNQHGKWANSKSMTVNADELEIYLTQQPKAVTVESKPLGVEPTGDVAEQSVEHLEAALIVPQDTKKLSDKDLSNFFTLIERIDSIVDNDRETMANNLRQHIFTSILVDNNIKVQMAEKVGSFVNLWFEKINPPGVILN